VLFLRDGRTRRGEKKDSEKASDSAHQQLYFLWVCRKLESNCNLAKLQNSKNQTLTPNGEKPLFDKTWKLPDIDAR
jgi:hypothetical protein